MASVRWPTSRESSSVTKILMSMPLFTTVLMNAGPVFYNYCEIGRESDEKYYEHHEHTQQIGPWKPFPMAGTAGHEHEILDVVG